MDAQWSSIDNKMPSEAPALPTQTEKPSHYMYLKEFRTQQCPLFQQHKCTQHRPFTCFHWHFMNQRRRRPVRKRDGTFNYSPDVYCTKFDETSGLCPEGDDCPFLHRTAGDTERRYHLRYYKTGTCVHETDARGHCVKNGAHCAFAHGAHDLRPPVYDIRELQAVEPILVEKIPSNPSTPSSSLEKDKILNEDPKWNDTNYVLANYKTEQCKRPPRLCRQGYACPQYHNTRDRRRSPKKHKYRSTPCPNVKHGDDWGDPTQCENGDNCAYCHTRTEQQFHPEIYKSTKCNDMVQTGYCPRGPFCAFAHVEQEMTTQRDISINAENSLAAFVTSALPQSMENNNRQATDMENSIDHLQHITNFQNLELDVNLSSNKLPAPIGKERANSTSCTNNSLHSSLNNNHTSPTLPDPIGKGRCNSASSMGSDASGLVMYHPKSDDNPTLYSTRTHNGTDKMGLYAWTLNEGKLRQQLQLVENDLTLDIAEKAKRKQNLMLLHSGSLQQQPGGGGYSGSIAAGNATGVTSNMSPLAPSFYPPGDTVELVVGSALEDLCLDDFDISNIDKELEKDNDSTSVSSSLSAGLSASGCFGTTSVPVAIPPVSGGGMQRGSAGSLSQSPPSPFGSFTPSFGPLHIPVHHHPKQEQQFEQAAVAFLSHANPGKYSAPAITESSMSPRSAGPHSPMYSTAVTSSQSTELQKLREELHSNKTKLAHWEEVYSQAKCACDAWKKETEESLRKAKVSEEEKILAIKQRDEAYSLLKKGKVDEMNTGSLIRSLGRGGNEIDVLTIPQLRHFQQQLRQELEKIDKLIYQKTAIKCVICLEKNRMVPTSPCNHCVMCDTCAPKILECPLCHIKIQRTNLPYRI